MDLLPRFTAEDSIDRPDRVQPAFTRDPNRRSLVPTTLSAKACGADVQRRCNNQLASAIFLNCDQIDCEELCRPTFPNDPASALCDACVARRTSCEQNWRNFFADCATCSPGTTCKQDYQIGYSFCCPPELSPCGGRCMEIPSSCGTGEFERVYCECNCLAGGGCRGDDGRVTDCCEGTEVCSHGHCCEPGQQWVDGQCCDPNRTCLEPLNWTTSGLYAEVSDSRETCCKPPLVCAPDHGPPGSLLAPGSPAYGHCCQPDERWITNWDVGLQKYAGKCCAPDKVCQTPAGWSNGVVVGSRDVCCAQGEDCVADDRWPPYRHCCPAGQKWCTGPDGFAGHCCNPGKCCGWGCCSASEHWSYTQKLWMRVKRKAAYLPG